MGEKTQKKRREQRLRERESEEIQGEEVQQNLNSISLEAAFLITS